MPTLTDTFLRHYRELLGFLSSRTGSRDTAQDCAQDTWLRLHHHDARIRPDNPRAYLFRTAANIAMDWHRARARERDAHARYASLQLPAQECDTLDVACARQTLARLERALRTQPTRSLEIFVMHRHDGYAYRDIAKRLNISTSAVEKHMMRILLACEQVFAA
ncbi:RNA polymerase sigma factor [Bordetella trematum]|uniref:RNA polymerase sigma factor n=1 Tax=Bordetella trematum TaxID=123899 RepID=UPI000D891685|nr:RNA polymerase sigma factor [Bordetella trematum]SPU49889.1 ECF family sigma factor [Bordetella trematum]VDH07632.1 Probable RNA polymerase sigma factor fecI [Bordetella trematum]